LAVGADLGVTIIALRCAVVIVAANTIGDLNRVRIWAVAQEFIKSRVSNRGVTGLMPLPLLSC
jgi:hypothetical protein